MEAFLTQWKHKKPDVPDEMSPYMLWDDISLRRGPEEPPYYHGSLNVPGDVTMQDQEAVLGFSDVLESFLDHFHGQLLGFSHYKIENPMKLTYAYRLDVSFNSKELLPDTFFGDVERLVLWEFTGFFKKLELHSFRQNSLTDRIKQAMADFYGDES